MDLSAIRPQVFTGLVLGGIFVLLAIGLSLIFGLMTGFLAMFDLKPEDDNVHLCGSPLYHTAVLVFLGASLHMGHAVVLMERWRPEAMLELIQRHRVTHSHMVPTQFHRLLGLPREQRDAYDVSSLRAMVHAAAPCPVETKWKMRSGPSFSQRWRTPRTM